MTRAIVARAHRAARTTTTTERRRERRDGGSRAKPGGRAMGTGDARRRVRVGARAEDAGVEMRAFERGARRAGAEHARMRTRTRANDAKASERAAPDAARIEWRQKLSIACVMLAVFLHLLGFTVTGPITPGLVRRFGVAAENVGYLTSAYPLGMFGALFFWPQLSDKVGRKPIIVLSLMGVGIGLILQGLCVRSGASFETFLLLRVLSGAFAGASPVVKAYLADASTPEFLPQLMAWREASCTLAFIVGPTLGGVLFAGFSLSAAISVTGWASVAAATLVLLFMTPPQAMKASMRETTEGDVDDASELEKDKVDEGKPSTAYATPSSPIAGVPTQTTLPKTSLPGVYDPDALSCPLGQQYLPAVATICMTSFLYNAGQSTFDSFFPLLLSKKLSMAPTQIGALLTALSAVSLTVSATLFAPTQKLFGLTKTTVIGLTLVATGLVAIGQAAPALVPPAAFVYVAGLPLFTPAIPILLMQCVPPTRRGTVMGVDSAINAVARIIAPIVFGKLFAADPAYAFVGAGVVVACAAILVLTRRFIVLQLVSKCDGVNARA